MKISELMSEEVKTRLDKKSCPKAALVVCLITRRIQAPEG